MCILYHTSPRRVYSRLPPHRLDRRERGEGMKKNGYLFNAVLLTATSLILRAAGMVFRVVVAGQVGAEGMGLHQLIFTVYQLFVTLATAGVPIAATRLVTEELAANRPGAAAGALRRTVLLGLCLGLAGALVQAGFAGVMSRWWLGDLRAAPSLRILAPSLPFMAMAAALRGYFLARRRAAPNAVSQLFEQALRIWVVLELLKYALPHGIGWACAAMCVGNTVSEAASCLLMALCTARDLRRMRGGAPTARPDNISHRLYEIVWPISAGRLLSSALRTAENVMVPACLTIACASRAVALEQYGALKGMAMPVVFFPFSLLGTLATLLTPEITEAHLKGHERTLRRLVGRVIVITNLISILLGGLFTLLARPLGIALYQSEEIGLYLAVLGPLMPLMYLESMVDGILKGLNEQMASFKYSVWDSALRIGLIAFLVPQTGMWGFLGVMVFSNLLTSLLNFRRLLVVTEMKLQLWRWFAGPVLCAVVCCAAARKWVWPLAEQQPAWVLIGVVAAAVTVGYLLLVLVCGILRPDDLRKVKNSAGSK